MAHILEYAISPKPLISRKIGAALTLIIGAAIYAALCWPAMHQRGYPPLDHFWTGMTYLWVFPIPLFTLLCAPGKFSRRVLVVYALATAYIDGCTVVMLVPHRFNPFEGIPMLPLLGPIHLIGTGVIAWISRFIFRALDIPSEPESSEKTEKAAIGKFGAILVILAAAAGFPYVFRLAAKALDIHEGAARAESVWADHSAYILSNSFMTPRQAGNYDIINYFDAGSGFPLRSEMGHEYEQGYKARIQELLSIHGVPSWSHKEQLVSDADLLGMLDAKGMTPVRSYPFDISPGVVLTRRGTLNRWGVSFSSGSNSLDIETQCGGNFGAADYFGDAEIGRLPKYPGVTFVRAGDLWIAAVSDDGWILTGAIKSQ